MQQSIEVWFDVFREGDNTLKGKLGELIFTRIFKKKLSPLLKSTFKIIGDLNSNFRLHGENIIDLKNILQKYHSLNDEDRKVFITFKEGIMNGEVYTQIFEEVFKKINFLRESAEIEKIGTEGEMSGGFCPLCLCYEPKILEEGYVKIYDSKINEEIYICVACAKKLEKKKYIKPARYRTKYGIGIDGYVWKENAELFYAIKKYEKILSVVDNQMQKFVELKLTEAQINFLSEACNIGGTGFPSFDFIAIDEKGEKYLIEVKSCYKSTPKLTTNQKKFIEHAKKLGFKILIAKLEFYPEWNVKVKLEHF